MTGEHSCPQTATSKLHAHITRERACVHCVLARHPDANACRDARAHPLTSLSCESPPSTRQSGAPLRTVILLGSLSEVFVLDQSRDTDVRDTRGPGRHAHARLLARRPPDPAASTPSAWCAALRGPRTLPRGRPRRPLVRLSGRSRGAVRPREAGTRASGRGRSL